MVTNHRSALSLVTNESSALSPGPRGSVVSRDLVPAMIMFPALVTIGPGSRRMSRIISSVELFSRPGLTLTIFRMITVTADSWDAGPSSTSRNLWGNFLCRVKALLASR